MLPVHRSLDRQEALGYALHFVQCHRAWQPKVKTCLSLTEEVPHRKMGK
jgi:hypothetical protein